MKTFVGTSGFSYPTWKGVFYPPTLKAADFLSYYGSRLSAVEINNTFYRFPRAPMLQAWRDKTPEDFRFAIKASRRITHFKKLRGTGELLGVLATSLTALGSRLGPVLFQLPPTLRGEVGLLREFLADVDSHLVSVLPELRVVLEFRHASWLTDEVIALLADRGVALCATDGDDEGRGPVPLQKTCSWAYLRLRKDDYTQQELNVWVDQLRALGVQEAFVFFKHEETGPALAERLAAALG